MDRAARIRRRFLHLEGRQVHYLRAGTGAPVVLIHSSPTHAGYLTPLIDRLSRRNTVFAFDNPGFGNSDPLSRGTLVIADIADALAEALRAMGFPPSPVYGSHTGAAIGLELGVRHPDLVTGLILDGVPIFTREEVEARDRDGYFFPLEPHALGGHLTNTWTRFRDQMMFHPWCTKTPENAHRSGLHPTAENTHMWVSMFFLCARHFEAVYRAAHHFGDVAAARIQDLERPCVFTAASSDGLARQFPRFPSLKPDQTIVPLDDDPESRLALLEARVAQWTHGAPAPADIEPAICGQTVRKCFIDLDQGQCLVRCCGQTGDPPLIFLHDAPGSGQAWEQTITALGLRRQVFALDLPGCGESDALPQAAPSISDYAAAVARVCGALGVTRTSVYGTGFGASVALELARAKPELVAGVVLRGVLLADDPERREMRASYAAPITLEPDGSHWYRTWLMLRDSQVYWPWYKRDAASVRSVQGDFDAARLHDWTVEVMKQHHAYHHLIEAALDHDAQAALSQVASPMLICEDPSHPFWAYQAKLRALTGHAERFTPAGVYEDARAITEFAARTV